MCGCVLAFIQHGLHFHIQTWFNKLITVKVYDDRKGIKAQVEERVHDFVKGFVHRLFVLL